MAFRAFGARVALPPFARARAVAVTAWSACASSVCAARRSPRRAVASIAVRASDVDVTTRPSNESTVLAMDYAGQRLAERVAQVVMTAFTCAGFAYGYYAGSYRAMLTVFASGCVAATVASAPAWGIYRRHPVRWASAPTKTNR